VGKQDWNFINNPNTTISKILKAKFFSNIWYLDAKLRHKPSYAWHSIFASHILVKDDILWRIDGSSINIWSQPWVQASGSSYITSSTPLDLEDLKVSPLINHQQQCWHQVVVQQISNDNDQRNVASHPLLNSEVDDKIIWRLTANGEYNIKSSYHNVMEKIIQNNH